MAVMECERVAGGSGCGYILSAPHFICVIFL